MCSRMLKILELMFHMLQYLCFSKDISPARWKWFFIGPPFFYLTPLFTSHLRLNRYIHIYMYIFLHIFRYLGIYLPLYKQGTLLEQTTLEIYK